MYHSEVVPPGPRAGDHAEKVRTRLQNQVTTGGRKFNIGRLASLGVERVGTSTSKWITSNPAQQANKPPMPHPGPKPPSPEEAARLATRA
jgi:hypothetical protein